uniref:Uncharacterized protein n=1 Tax=Chromera velia CCMP2878 TaxID=1169474 RepID=A0A0G4FGT5_9ALVE|eukprot:Cvel_16922.t1-p1 / transcript=Cvel_16922.t1 / gene=Cvel_16922 / organism=Chromera_velia_CCMP2878 / gene_product=hypothetical protein / transcript_product=hypothetical protein / location=Cvel_scaffold1326:2147-6126(+) / protein_length=403 / sequence_SO=supercontig / SO=protein_coding / is_pseudo=false
MHRAAAFSFLNKGLSLSGTASHLKFLEEKHRQILLGYPGLPRHVLRLHKIACAVRRSRHPSIDQSPLMGSEKETEVETQCGPLPRWSSSSSSSSSSSFPSPSRSSLCPSVSLASKVLSRPLLTCRPVLYAVFSSRSTGTALIATKYEPAAVDFFDRCNIARQRQDDLEPYRWIREEGPSNLYLYPIEVLDRNRRRDFYDAVLQRRLFWERTLEHLIDTLASSSLEAPDSIGNEPLLESHSHTESPTPSQPSREKNWRPWINSPSRVSPSQRECRRVDVQPDSSVACSSGPARSASSTGSCGGLVEDFTRGLEVVERNRGKESSTLGRESGVGENGGDLGSALCGTSEQDLTKEVKGALETRQMRNLQGGDLERDERADSNSQLFWEDLDGEQGTGATQILSFS